MFQYPSLADLEPTRRTLQLYANAVGVITRAHARFHPQWWHISLRPAEKSLRTTQMQLPDGESFWLEMDLQHHVVRLETEYGGTQAISITAGLTGTEFGDQLLAAVAKLGVTGEYAREKFEDAEPRTYNPAEAGKFWSLISHVNQLFSAHRATLTGTMGPIQLWPHGFDLAFEWFGTRSARYEGHGEDSENPSQLNLGFYAGSEGIDPYFYSCPWPFDAEVLLDEPLPDGVSWNTKGWEGTYLPYSTLVAKQDADKFLLDYAREIYDLTTPALLA